MESTVQLEARVETTSGDRDAFPSRLIDPGCVHGTGGEQRRGEIR